MNLGLDFGLYAICLYIYRRLWVRNKYTLYGFSVLGYLIGAISGTGDGLSNI